MQNETETGYGLTYTGVEGLTVSYATTDIDQVTSTATSGDHTAMKVTYAYGPVTVRLLKHLTMTLEQLQDDTEFYSITYGIAYTVSDDFQFLTVSEEISRWNNYRCKNILVLVVSYTSGGMTLQEKWNMLIT